MFSASQDDFENIACLRILCILITSVDILKMKTAYGKYFNVELISVNKIFFWAIVLDLLLKLIYVLMGHPISCFTKIVYNTWRCHNNSDNYFINQKCFDNF